MTGKDTQPPSGVGSSRTQSQPAASGAAAGQFQPISDTLGAPLTPGGMRGIGLLVFMAAQISLKLKTVGIARDYYNINAQEFLFNQVHHQPHMQGTQAEVMSPIWNPYYQADLYASAPAGISTSKAVDRKWYETRRRVGRYNTGAQSRIDYEFAVLRSAAVTSGWNMGRRYEMAWADAHNERAYNRKLAMANVGIQAGNTMRQGLATAVGNLQNAYQGIGDSVSSAANGYFAKSGSEQGRSQTRQRYGEGAPNTSATRRVGPPEM